MEDANDPSTITTRLLTLLNVSATKSLKRRRLYDEVVTPVKLNKRKSVRIAEDIIVSIPLQPEKGQETVSDTKTDQKTPQEGDIVQSEEDGKDDEPSSSSLQLHFGPDSVVLTESARTSTENRSWVVSKDKKEQLGIVAEYRPETHPKDMLGTSSLTEKLMSQHKKQQEKLPNELKLLQDCLLVEISAYQDFHFPRLNHERHPAVRNVVTLHALNHVMRKRRRILKNNERLARAAKESSEPEVLEIRDQGFTRPSVLIIVPFRSWALSWIESFTSHAPKPEFQVENHARFLSEYALPPSAVDKLEAAPPGTYPPDHVDMFKGNIDDSFRLGVKFTRKSVKLFSDFYQSDVIIASPLGLRLSIEKEKNADFLSSIEILVLDQMNALSMQNWEHLQFVLSNLNTLPKETRDTDFSRIKPWYLDGHACYLRQTIMLSPFETPEFRHVFNDLKNVGGKKKVEGPYAPVQVPEGISQSFTSFECSNHKEEADKRFEHFGTKLFPAVLKSAVQSTNTLIFVPSSYDFIRVENHLRKSGVSFVVLSEYSSNQDISRARQAFFSGKKAFLLISERFHFFRRYKLRGIRNLIFYGLPDHTQFYTELLSFPFLDDGVEASDVTCRALFCKYDWMRLERIAGTEGALKLLRNA
ncbi:digestive organ expansion factor [Fomitiporia mediterranea MF3/22]|uniref:digestive organ expansion factor n=1 Tax=Fomitiporia mediterranea (strain MF3/22) TaxID=694068 RepID=UPI00044072FC|nr:digestive organ expansion factor [Fomitiporia mediterranea MF3/22]EJD03205.1 digestive organ expansion factor [Fomitiporia mediterranea MF3/22]